MIKENNPENNCSNHNICTRPFIFIKNIFVNVWQIRKNELSKFLHLASLMFCILAIQNLIRASKDSVINTMVGTETISFLKFGGVMPASLLMTIIYIKLVDKLRGDKIFYLITSSFLMFFALFAFYLLPYHEMIHLSESNTSYYISNYPHFKWLILLFSKWSFTIFYIIAELWPSTVFGLLFWQFVNNIVSVDESKRFYLTFGLIGQTGLILCGEFLSRLDYLSDCCRGYVSITSNDSKIMGVQIVVLIVLLLGFASLYLFERINKNFASSDISFKTKGKKMSFRDSLKLVFTSRYIGLIAIVVISYGFAINLVEGPWKKQASILYPNSTEYLAFVGGYLKYTGFLTIFFVIIGSNIVKYIGWFATAIISPIILFVTGILFFAISNFDYLSISITSYFMLSSPLILTTLIGAIQNVLSKSSKYTLFDSTKEMSYVPLDKELKTKGKAAVDVVGTKLGKSLGALLQAALFTIFPAATFASISPILMVSFTIVCMIWIVALIKLNAEYTDLTKDLK